MAERSDAAPTPHLRDAPLPRWVAQAHRRDSRDVAFTVDGGRVATIGDDAPIHLWDAFTGARVRTFAGHRRGGEALAIHPDGAWLFSAGRDKAVRVWHLETGEELACFEGHGGGVTAMAISPDGAFAATGSTDRGVCIWDARSGDCLATWKGHADPVRFVTFTDLGGFPWVWSGCESGVLIGGPVGAEKPSHRMVGHRVIARDPHNDRIIERSTFHDARQASQAAVRLFGPDGVGPPESRLEGHLGEVRCATFTPAGIALTGSADRGLRRFAIDGSLVSHLRAGGAACDRLAVHPKGALVAIGDADGRLLVFDGGVVFDDVFEPPHRHAISAVGVDDRGRPWSLGRDGRLVVRGDDLRPVHTHPLREVDSMHSSAGFVAGGWWRHGPVTVSSSQARGIERWEMINRPSVEAYHRVTGASADGAAVGTERVAVTLLDGTLRLLDIGDLREVARVDLSGYPLAVTIRPDDRVAVVDDKGELVICDRDGGAVERHAVGRVTALAYGPEGALYTGGRDGRVRRFGGEALAGWHDGPVSTLAFAGDGVVSAGADRRVIARRGDREVRRWTLPVPVTALAPFAGGVIYGDAAGAMGRLAPG